MLLDTLLAEPNVRWCEAHVAGPLLEPGNCASSLAYLVALPLGARGDAQLSDAVVGWAASGRGGAWPSLTPE